MSMPVDATIRRLDAERHSVSAQLAPERKATLGQFMTPAPVAEYLAALFDFDTRGPIRLLDPGAGMGALSAAFVHRWLDHAPAASTLAATAYEIDPLLCERLRETLRACQAETAAAGRAMSASVCQYDFVQAATHPLEFLVGNGFTHAILNPPYKKIPGDSPHRRWLRAAGIETVNLYAAFVALTLDLLADGGQLVAIIPRSFCNGPYYRPFREFLLRRAAITHIHLFGSRQDAFRDDEVLQENVIIKLVRSQRPSPVVVSHSHGSDFSDSRQDVCEWARIVRPDDPEGFIHVPDSDSLGGPSLPPQFGTALAELGIEVSTGPVVDFRLASFLRAEPESGTVPLLYPCHCGTNSVTWPLAGGRKPNAIAFCEETRKWLYPAGWYTVVRRFSAKEERRRLVASVVQPGIALTDWIGFENHLNVFHQARHGLSEDLAWGLSTYLNSTLLDQFFRQFNGHTQVNATDLRSLRYPGQDALVAFGRKARQAGNLEQTHIDDIVGGR